jgi:hypothetical protein
VTDEPRSPIAPERHGGLRGKPTFAEIHVFSDRSASTVRAGRSRCDTLRPVAALWLSMKRPATLVVPLVFAAIVACGSVPQTGGQTVGRITYTVSGGIAGWQRTLTIEPDGTAVVQVLHGPSPGTSQHQVEATELKRLHDLVRDPAFAALQKEYLPTPGGADLQDYTISVELDGRTIETMTRDGAGRPQILGDVLDVLNHILAGSFTR